MFPINHIKVEKIIWFHVYITCFQKEFKAAEEFKEDI